MSDEAVEWVLWEAPNVPPHTIGTLLGIAIYADETGCGSFPSQETIAFHAHKTDRAVRNDLRRLEKEGLIREGNQRLVAHIPADERPTVWDLPMERRREPMPQKDRKQSSGPSDFDRKQSSGPSRGSGSRLPVEPSEGPEADFRSNLAGTGSTLPPEPEGAEADFRPNGEGPEADFRLKKKRKISSSSPHPIARIADALTIDEDEARTIYDRIVADPNVRAPSAYIERLIETGDITRWHTPPVQPAKPAYSGPMCDLDDPQATGWCQRRGCGLPATHLRHGARS